MTWRRFLKNRRLIIIVSLILLIISSLVVASLGRDDKAAIAKKEIADVRVGDLVVTINVDGNLTWLHQAKLTFGTAGTVKEIKVKEGERVVKGQVLATLDTASLLELAVKMAELDLEIAENTYWNMIYPRYTETGATDLPGVQIALRIADDYLEEARELLAKGELEAAQTRLELVQKELRKAQVKTKGRLLWIPPSFRIAELQLEKAKLVLHKANLELEKAIITAPFDGTVARIGVKVGDTLSTMNYATTTAIHLISPGVMEVEGIIDETDIAKAKTGQEAIIIVDAFPGEELKGKVTSVSQAPKPGMGGISYEVTVTLEPFSSPELLEGMTATAKIVTERRSQVLLVPNRALKGTPDAPWVQVIVEDKIEPRQVKIGLSDGKHTEVIQGLTEGERVVVEPRPDVVQLFRW